MSGTAQFLVDEQGQRKAVVLAIEHYLELLEAQEELAAIRQYDLAKAVDDEAIPFAQAVYEIEGISQQIAEGTPLHPVKCHT